MVQKCTEKRKCFERFIHTISSLGFTRSIECRLIACIAALLPPPETEQLDDVDSVGDAAPVSANEVAGTGFLIIVTACATFVCGPAAMRR